MNRAETVRRNGQAVTCEKLDFKCSDVVKTTSFVQQVHDLFNPYIRNSVRVITKQWSSSQLMCVTKEIPHLFKYLGTGHSYFPESSRSYSTSNIKP